MQCAINELGKIIRLFRLPIGSIKLSLQPSSFARYNALILERHNQTNNRNLRADGLRFALSGITLPIPIPFDEHGGSDLSALRSNIQSWNQTGISGYVISGSTGERAHLDDYECLEIIKDTHTLESEGLSLIAGAGGQSTRLTVNEVHQVAEAGANAVLVITPHFYRAEMTQSALINHYLAVADASPVPVLLYSVPQFTGVMLQPETVARLAEHENIVGVKDSSGDIVALAEMVRLVRDDFAVLTGNGSALYPALCVGAKGGILAVGCIAPSLAVAIYEAFQKGEHERARTLQQKLSVLTRRILTRYGIGGLKAALDMLGYVGGRVRAPLQDASTEARHEIEKVLRETGLLGDEAEGGVVSVASQEQA